MHFVVVMYRKVQLDVFLTLTMNKNNFFMYTKECGKKTY